MIGHTELAILGAAAYRGTQLIVWDTITQPIRDRIEQWHIARPDAKPRKWLHDLISCPYCAGMWVSGIALLIYLVITGRWDDSPWIVHGIEWFAVAGVQALANRWDDTRSNP